jgi:hypothetical protein
MKVNELLMNIHNKEFNLERALEVKTYLPIEAKKTIAQGIIYECVDETDGIFKIDSVQRYLSYVKYMITMHTNLEYADDDYDVLCSTECNGVSLLNAIMDCFGDDAKECSRILNLVTDDYMQERSLESSVAKFLNGLSSTVASFAQKVGDLDLQSMIPDNMDMDKLNTFLNNYIK